MRDRNCAQTTKVCNKCGKETGALYPMYERPDDLAIITLEGLQRVTMNDYIIQGVMGEIYPIKEDIFEMTYEAVE
jgi:hypothetical protein